MLETAIEEKKKREDLKARRDLLFARYLKLPMDTQLAREIKVIVDQLAEERKKSQQLAWSPQVEDFHGYSDFIILKQSIQTPR